MNFHTVSQSEHTSARRAGLGAGRNLNAAAAPTGRSFPIGRLLPYRLSLPVDASLSSERSSAARRTDLAP
eukprot:SAG31_NODE_17243_length_678_cov_0.877375_2_plen_69_part_01